MSATAWSPVRSTRSSAGPQPTFTLKDAALFNPFMLLPLFQYHFNCMQTGKQKSLMARLFSPTFFSFSIFFASSVLLKSNPIVHQRTEERVQLV
jgi:hypothetical protein